MLRCSVILGESCKDRSYAALLKGKVQSTRSTDGGKTCLDLKLQLLFLLRDACLASCLLYDDYFNTG